MVEKPATVLVGDALALDFLNTAVGVPQEGRDLLQTGEGLMAWMTQVRLLERSVARQIQQATPVDELNQVAANARDLREWFREFVLARKGRNLTVEDALASERLNRLLAADDMFSKLVASDESSEHPIQLQSVRRNPSSRSLISLLAEVLARFLCEEAFVNVKVCEGPGCHLLFVDHTRGRGRRWCSMSMCGNRAKQAAHRSRRRSPTSGPGELG